MSIDAFILIISNCLLVPTLRSINSCRGLSTVET